MGSPKFIYKGLTQAELMNLRAIALSRQAGGDLESLSGAAKSSTRKFSMSAEDMLAEVNYALGQLGLTEYQVPPQKVHQRYDYPASGTTAAI